MKKLILTAVALMALNAHAQIEEKTLNGGDAACERRVQEIRDDIRSWIVKGGHKNLRYKKGTTALMYQDLMLQNMADVVINCPDKLPKVYGTDKICVNYKDNSGTKHMDCAFSRFNAIGEEKQYHQVHHEYAGAAGLETNNGKPESDYRYTNQVTIYLEPQEILRLAITPRNGQSKGINIKGIGRIVFSNITQVGNSVLIENPRLIVSGGKSMLLWGWEGIRTDLCVMMGYMWGRTEIHNLEPAGTEVVMMGEKGINQVHVSDGLIFDGFNGAHRNLSAVKIVCYTEKKED